MIVDDDDVADDVADDAAAGVDGSGDDEMGQAVWDAD